MNKKQLIKRSKEIRLRKDNMKEVVKKGGLVKKQDEGFRVVVPPLVHNNSLENSSDKWYFNGFVIDLHGDLIIVDPGVDFYSRFSKTGLNLMNAIAVIITHSHTDHIASLSVIIEKLLRDKVTKRQFFISKLAFEDELSDYHQEMVRKSKNTTLVLLSEGKGIFKTLLGKHKIEFVPLVHSAKETFGFKIKHKKNIFGHVSDTGYSIKIETNEGVYPPEEVKGEFRQIVEKQEYLKKFYRKCDIVAVNINDLHYNRHSKYHLSGWDVLDLFKGTSVRKLIFLHLSPANAECIGGNEIYTAFFKSENYETFLPISEGLVIEDD
ncbi:MBL fold metallo-hydrolase [Candidatus Woesebacteria bacterium]|nr:MBL fold metallo-hydrolase [Candidatus Woesebacteria bacterium]